MRKLCNLLDCAKHLCVRRCRLLLNGDNLDPQGGADVEMGAPPPVPAGWAEIPLQPIPAEMDKQTAGMHVQPYPPTIMPVVNPMSTSQRELHAAV